MLREFQADVTVPPADGSQRQPASRAPRHAQASAEQLNVSPSNSARCSRHWSCARSADAGRARAAAAQPHRLPLTPSARHGSSRS
jgi:hypothetical protein